MLATENRIQTRVRVCQVVLLAPAELRPLLLALKMLGIGFCVRFAGGGRCSWKCPGELSERRSQGKNL